MSEKEKKVDVVLENALRNGDMENLQEMDKETLKLLKKALLEANTKKGPSFIQSIVTLTKERKK